MQQMKVTGNWKERGQEDQTRVIQYYFIHNFRDNYEVTGSCNYSDSFVHAFFSVSNVIIDKCQSLVSLIVFLTRSLILKTLYHLSMPPEHSHFDFFAETSIKKKQKHLSQIWWSVKLSTMSETLTSASTSFKNQWAEF